MVKFRALLLFAVAGCNAIFGHERGWLEPSDASLDAPAPSFNALGDKSQWSAADPPSAPAYGGLTFDGRWIYAPSASPLSGVVSRYDTTASFESAAAWQAFDLSTLDPRCRGFAGAVFDGRDVYVVPHSNGTALGLVARYDATADFSSAGAWTLFDLSAVDSAARGFAGGVFDGRFVYFVPSFNFSGRDGVVARYDAKADFQSPASWRTFDAATLDPRARGFFGGAFDGRYAYFVPNVYGEPHGLLVRVDTAGDFSAASAWTVFDVQTVFSHARGFAGAAFDDRYVYFAPIDAIGGLAVRLDTTMDVTNAAAWSATSLSFARASGFTGAEFDGRYIYFVPAAPSGSVLDLVRYDTHQAFESLASYETFDLDHVSTAASGFTGGGFDGRAVFMAPSSGSPFVRFVSRSPAGGALPPASFF